MQSSGKIRTFEIVQEVTGILEGGFEDWPAQIQDQVMAALERKAKEVGLMLVLVGAACGMDYGDTEKQDKPYVRIIASEVLVKDTGYDKRVIDAALNKIH